MLPDAFADVYRALDAITIAHYHRLASVDHSDPEKNVVG